jgi:hypothetical protein
VSWPIQDHADVFLALLAADPLLTTYDGAIPKPGPPAEQYALVYFYVETPDGLVAPDKVRLSGDSDVVESRAYVHCVGGTAASARAISGRVRARVLNVRPVVTNRVCFPIRWREGQPPRRDEETGRLVMDQVDVYGWSSVPA